MAPPLQTRHVKKNVKNQSKPLCVCDGEAPNLALPVFSSPANRWLQFWSFLFTSFFITPPFTPLLPADNFAGSCQPSSHPALRTLYQ